MKGCIALLLLTTTLQLAAAPKAERRYYAFLTVDTFVETYRGTPQPGVTQVHAQGYAAAVADLSQNRSWCPPGGSDPGKLEAGVVDALASSMPGLGKLPGKPLLIAAAAHLLSEYVSRYPSRAGACPFTPRMDEAAFAKDLFGAVVPGSENSPLEQSADAAQRESFARGYLDGVIDASQGRSACPPPRLKPVEVSSHAAGDVRAHMAHQAAQANAAVLIAELLTARFPCKR
jgi:hypothetical protein